MAYPLEALIARQPVAAALAEALPVDAALRALGICRTGDLDEFDRVGLGRHRSTQEWAADQ
jgi:hypothetical protein